MGHTRRAVRFFAALVVATVLSAGSARAAPTAPERETARRLMDEGKARIKANEPLRAVEAFQKAHDIMHVPTTGLALAKAHVAAGHLVEARDTALEVGRLPHESGEPTVFESARRQAKELETQLKPRIPTLRIRIKGTPVRVAIDDVEVALAILNEPVAVNPGKRMISARNADGVEAKGEIELGEREVREIELSFPAHGDAAKTATPAPAPTTAPATATTTQTKVRGFGNDDVGPRSAQRTQPADVLMYGGGGLAALGLTVGVITGALTLSKAGDVRPQCDNNVCAPSASDDLDTANTLATVSTVAFVVGAAGAALAVIGFAMPRKPAQRRGAASLSLSVGPVGVGGVF